MASIQRSTWLLCALLAGSVISASATNFTLPSLPYMMDQFEPSIDNETMTLHWVRHTAASMSTLNGALVRCPDLQGLSLLELLDLVGTADLNSTCATPVRNGAGGTWNHFAFYTQFLAPYGNQTWEANASQELKDAVTKAFGSVDAFKAAFKSAASGLFGSGWAWLCVDPSNNTLAITTTPNQDNPLMSVAPKQCAPVLGLDVWEHAYYLKYRNVRADYIDAFWNVVNWAGVSDMFSKAVSGEPGFDATAGMAATNY